jgi:hypothetical protein
MIFSFNSVRQPLLCNPFIYVQLKLIIVLFVQLGLSRFYQISLDCQFLFEKYLVGVFSCVEVMGVLLSRTGLTRTLDIFYIIIDLLEAIMSQEFFNSQQYWFSSDVIVGVSPQKTQSFYSSAHHFPIPPCIGDDVTCVVTYLPYVIKP